ncbi:MAG: phage tail tape measure protein [Deltaproteobacteria bacterium]|nr:phage tail tape measure protein [Deltaproteobacteria bacterium]
MNGVAFKVASIMSLVDKISGPLRFIKGRMGDVENKTRSVTASLANFTLKMAKAAAVGGAFLAVLGGVALTTIPTGRALGELASVGITDMQALESAASDFSNQFAGTSKVDFLSASYDIKSGIASLSDEGVAGFTKLAAMTGKATKSTVNEMTSLFATGYGIYKEQYARLNDFQFGELFSAGIAASVQQFKTTGSGMSQAISTLGATATKATVPLQEQLAVMGMLQATMTGSEAGTKYKAFIMSTAKAGDQLGLNFLDANKQVKSLPAVLDVLKSKFGETLDAAEKVDIQKAFGREEAVAVIDLLYSKTGALRDNINSLGGALQKGKGFTLAMAQTMNKDLGATIDTGRQRVRNLVEMIGSMFAPTLNKIIGVISGVLMLIMGWIGRNKELVKTVLSVAAGIAAAVVGVTALSAAGAGLGFVMTWLAGTVAMISWPLWAVMGAATLLYIAWRRNFGGMADSIAGFYKKASLVVRGVIALFRTLVNGHGTISGQLAEDIQAAGLVGLVTTVGRVVYRVQQFLGGLWESFVFTASGIDHIFMPVVDSLISALDPFYAILTSLTGGLIGASAATKSSSWRTFGEVLGMVAGSGLRLIAWGIRIMLYPLQGLLWLVGSGARLFVGLGEALGTVTAIIWGTVEPAFNVLWTIAKGLLGAVGKIATALPDAFMKVKEAVSGINLYESGARLMSTFSEGIKAKLSGPVDAVKGVLAKVRNYLPFSDAKVGPLSQLTASGMAVMDTLAAGMVKNQNTIRNAAAAGMAGIALSVAVPDLAPASDIPGAGSDRSPDVSKEVVREKDGGKKIIIENMHISLPSVSDGEGFVRDLKKLVEGFDA